MDRLGAIGEKRYTSVEVIKAYFDAGDCIVSADELAAWTTTERHALGLACAKELGVVLVE